jgi:5'-nucleotidase
MIETAMELSKELRDPKGEHQVDIIIALTHCRVPNVCDHSEAHEADEQDIALANELGAVADKDGVENTHGVDLIIGGHDHIYYIGKGAKSWEGDTGGRDGHGTEADKGVR